MLANPNLAFSKICAALEIPHIEAMFHWEKGPKPYDGPWSPYWYAKVHDSSGFGLPSPLRETLTGRYLELKQQALPYYEELWQQRLRLNTF